MSGFLAPFSRIRKLIHGLDGECRSNSDRPTVRPQLEHLEDRTLLSATSISLQPVNPSQIYQQLLQAEAHPSANLAPVLDNALSQVVVALPGISSLLNGFSTNLSAAVGPQKAPQYMQGIVQGIDSFLINLEGATLASLRAAGDFQDPTFNANVALINAFMVNPFNYAPPA